MRRPVIYEKDLKGYSHRNKRLATLSEMAEGLNNSCRGTWRSLGIDNIVTMF